MKLNTRIERKIKKYDPAGGLAQTARTILALSGVNHAPVKPHLQRVALLVEALAEKRGKDAKAAFFGGLLHDVGKILLPYQLFDGHNIDSDEYAEVKKHSIAGFEAFRELHLFTSLCAGCHHAMYANGYGLEMIDFPKEWGLHTVRKVLDISAMISVCDFIDAFKHRDTDIKDGSNKDAPDLRTMLVKKYPDDMQIIDVALRVCMDKVFWEEVAA